MSVRPEAVAVPAARRSQARGWWGVALLVATEGTLFGTIVGTYFYLRFKSAQWPPEGTPEPGVAVPLVLAGVLLATSAPMQLALAAGRAGRARAAQLLLLVALVVQSGYLAMQIHLFADDVRAHPPSANAYASVKDLLLGADHAHVAVGLAVTLFLLAKLADGRVTGYRRVALQCGAFYWHFVNVLTVVVTLVQISPRLG